MKLLSAGIFVLAGILMWLLGLGFWWPILCSIVATMLVLAHHSDPVGPVVVHKEECDDG